MPLLCSPHQKLLPYPRIERERQGEVKGRGKKSPLQRGISRLILFQRFTVRVRGVVVVVVSPAEPKVGEER